MQDTYPEIDALRNFHKKNKFKILRKTPSEIEGVFLLLIHLNNASFEVLVQDEYQDLDRNNPLLNIVLICREWELIIDSTDFLNWCKLQNFSGNSEFLRQYYQNSINKIPQISSYFSSDEITSFVSDLDFQLNAGVAQFLRSNR